MNLPGSKCRSRQRGDLSGFGGRNRRKKWCSGSQGREIGSSSRFHLLEWSRWGNCSHKCSHEDGSLECMPDRETDLSRVSK